jgi:hypothetical protein
MKHPGRESLVTVGNSVSFASAQLTERKPEVFENAGAHRQTILVL